MLATAAKTFESLFFVNRKEQDLEVPMAHIRERALSIAADLRNRGVRKGDRVALVLPTCPEFVECFFGGLDEYHRKTAAMLRAVDAAVVVTDERIRRFLGVAVDISAPRLGCLTASSLGGHNSIDIEGATDDVALIPFSSATRHHPKPVALTHANLLSNLAAIDRYLTD